MTTQLSDLDGLVVAGYLAAIAGVSLWLGRRRTLDSRDYFLGGGAVPPWLPDGCRMHACKSKHPQACMQHAATTFNGWQRCGEL